MKIKASSVKTDKGKADKLWRDCIKKRDPVCIYCGKRPTAQIHHLFSRRYNNTRHDLINGVGLCRFCHMEFHIEPITAHEFIKKKMGEYTYNALRIRAHSVGKKADYAMRIIELEEYLKILGKGVEKK